ncbi:MAG: hypothetical protein WC047_08510 [Kiritimatiellales bacterium]
MYRQFSVYILAVTFGFNLFAENTKLNSDPLSGGVKLLGDNLSGDYAVSMWGKGYLGKTPEQDVYLSGQPDPLGNFGGMAIVLKSGKSGIQLEDGSWQMYYEINYDSKDSVGNLNNIPQLQAGVWTDKTTDKSTYRRMTPSLDGDPSSWEKRNYDLGAGPMKIEKVGFQYCGENPPEGIKIRNIFFIKKEE